MELAINDNGSAGVIVNNIFKPFDKVSVQVRKEYDYIKSKYNRDFSLPRYYYLTLETYGDNPKIRSKEVDVLHMDNESVYKFYQAMISLQMLLNKINTMEEYISHKITYTSRCFMDADYEALYKLYDDLNDFKDKNPKVDIQHEMSIFGYGDCTMGLL